MHWLDSLHTSLFPCNAINQGVKKPFREVLLSGFANTHYAKQYYKKQKLEGYYNDLSTIIDLRTREYSAEEKILLKGLLQCWQPSCYMPDKSKGLQPEYLNPVLCLDFDHLEDWDIESLKQTIYALPFVCFVSLSCSGAGLYALILIEEPERLKEYAEHCFLIFQSYGIPIDTGKGQNPTQLRYVSYDENMLIKDDPVPLKIKRFNAPKPKDKPQAATYTEANFKSSSGLIKWACEQITGAMVGCRWATVQRVAFTMGGHGVGLEEILQVIAQGSQFTGEEDKYMKCAIKCFEDGRLKPIAA